MKKLQEISEGSVCVDGSGFEFIILENKASNFVRCKYMNTGYEFIAQRSNVARGRCKDLMQPNSLGAYIEIGRAHV